MRSESIEYFIKTVEAGSINKASEQLHLNHQTLGKIIKTLEEEVGTSLLEKNYAGVALTEDGKYIYEKFSEIHYIMKDIENYIAKKEAEKTIDLHFYLASGIFNRPIITKILNTKKEYPNINVYMEDAPYEVVLEKIYAMENSAGVFLLEENALKDIPTDFKIVSDKEHSLIAYVPKNNSLAKKGTVLLAEDLLREKGIVLYSAYDFRKNALYNRLKKISSMKNIQIVSNISTFYELMKTGRYITVGLFSPEIKKYKEGEMMSHLLKEDGAFKRIPVFESNEQIKMHAVWVTRKDVESCEELEYFVGLI